MLTNTEQLLSKTQTAYRLGVSTQTLDRIVGAGKMNAIKVGKFVKFSPQDIDDYLSRNSKLQTKPLQTV